MDNLGMIQPARIAVNRDPHTKPDRDNTSGDKANMPN